MTIDDHDIERALTVMADDGYPSSRDVGQAFLEFTARTARAERRKRITNRAVAAAAAAVVGIGGLVAYQAGDDGGRDGLQPATPNRSTTQLITAAELVGIWAVDADWLLSGFPWLWTFHADGSASGSPNADTAENTWEYSLTGNKIDARDRPPGACAYTWEVTRFDQGALNLDVLKHCGNTGPGIALTRLSPASAAGSAIAMPPMTSAARPGAVAEVGGVWLMQGTGMLLAIDARNRAEVAYRLDDKGALAVDPVDQGTAALDVRGNLTLASERAPATGCTSAQAARFVLMDVVIADHGLQARQGVESVCGRAELKGSWVRVAAP